MLFQGIAPVPSFFLRIFQMLLVQGQKCSFTSQCTVPGIQSRFRDPGLINFEIYYLYNYGAWGLFPCSRQLRFSIHYLQVGGMVLTRTLTNISRSYVEFTFVFAVIHTDL